MVGENQTVNGSHMRGERQDTECTEEDHSGALDNRKFVPEHPLDECARSE